MKLETFIKRYETILQEGLLRFRLSEEEKDAISKIDNNIILPFGENNINITASALLQFYDKISEDTILITDEFRDNIKLCLDSVKDEDIEPLFCKIDLIFKDSDIDLSIDSTLHLMKKFMEFSKSMCPEINEFIDIDNLSIDVEKIELLIEQQKKLVITDYDFLEDALLRDAFEKYTQLYSLKYSSLEVINTIINYEKHKVKNEH